MSESAKVCDTEIEQLAELAQCWSDIEEVLTKYVGQLEYIKTNAIKEGKVHTAIDNLHWYAQKYAELASGVGTNAGSKATSFLKKIEQIDLNLYNEV